MRAANGAVIALLAGSEYVRADLWTITLNGGTIIRWHNQDRPLGKISYGGNSWLKGPAIHRGAISEKCGVDVATLSVDLIALPSDLINGTPVIRFIAAHGLDGASVKLERAYAPDMPSLFGDHGSAGVSGTSIRFAGKISSIDQVQGAVASFTISSWLVLLNADMPRNLYQSACMHSLYDAGCGVNPVSYSNGGSVVSVSSNSSFTTSLEPGPTGLFDLGKITFFNGPNAGISRTVKHWDSSGFILTSPLPNTLLVGDGFNVSQGCNLTRSDCLNKFANLANYKGTDFVPIPTTPLTIPASSTTTTSGKGGEE